MVKTKSETEDEMTFGKFETFQKLGCHLSKLFANFFSRYFIHLGCIP